MWIIDPPSSTTRRASAAYSSGVYGIAGHWSRFATAPLIEFVMTTGSSKRLMRILLSWELAHVAEVVALALEVPACGGDLLDRVAAREAAALGRGEPLRLPPVAPA